MIRQFKESDTESIIDVWFRASQLATPFLSGEFLTEERQNIRDLWLPSAETWVYEDEGQVTGFLSLIGNEVGAIFVHPECQGKGVGRKLMDHAVSLRGGLFLDVFRDNQTGRRFYERYGFKFEREHMHEQSGHVQVRMTLTNK